MSVIILPDRWRQQPQVPVRLHNRWLDAKARSAALARGSNLHDLVQNKRFVATGSKTNNLGVAATFQAGQYLTLFPDTSKAFDTAHIEFTAIIVVDAYAASTDVGIFGTETSAGENDAIGFASFFTNGGSQFRHGSTRIYRFGTNSVNSPVAQVWAMSSYADGSAYMFNNGAIYQSQGSGFTTTTTNTSAFLINSYLRGTNSSYPSGAAGYYSWMFLDSSTPLAELQELSAKPYSIWTSNRKRRYFLGGSSGVPAGSANGTSTVNGIGRTLVRSTGTASGTGAASGASNSGQTGVRGRHRLVRTKQPQYAVAIDLANPLTRGLDLAFVPTLHGANPAGASFGFLGTPTPTRVGKKGEVAYSVVNGQNSAITAFPVVGAVPFTILAGVTFKNLNAPSFDANPGDGSAVIYSQRDIDSTRSPTFAISPSGGFAGSNGIFFGTDAAGTAHGANSSVAAPTGVPTVLGARSDPASATVAGYSYNGLSIFVDGKNTTTAPFSTAGSFSNDWNPLYPNVRSAIIGGHAEWPSQSYPTRDDADADYTFFFRWRRLLSDAEIAQITANPWQLFRARRDLSIGTSGIAATAGAAAGTSIALAVGQKLVLSTAASAGTSTVLGAPVSTAATLLGSSYTSTTTTGLAVTYTGGETVIVVVFRLLGYNAGDKVDVTDGAYDSSTGAYFSGTHNYVPITPFSNYEGGGSPSGVQFFKADKVKAGTFTLRPVSKFGGADGNFVAMVVYRYSGLATGPALAWRSDIADNPGLSDFAYSTAAITPTQQPALLLVAANEQGTRTTGSIYPESGYDLLNEILIDTGGTIVSKRITSLSSITPTMRSKQGYYHHSIQAVLLAEYVAPTLDYLAAGNLTRRRVLTAQPQSALQVDWSDPLTRGLVFALVPSVGRRNLVDNKGYTDDSLYKTVSAGPKGRRTETRGAVSTAQSVNNITTYSLLTAFVLPTAPSGTQCIFGSDLSGGDNQGFAFNSSHGNPIYTGAYYQSPNYEVVGTPFGGALSAGVRYQLGVTTVGATTALYAYGLPLGSAVTTTQAPRISSTSELHLNETSGGGGGTGTDAHFEYFFKWNRQLSAREVRLLSDNPWQIFKGRRQPVAAAPIVTAQFLRPASDVAAGTWTPSSGVDLYATLDETPANDSDYDSTISASSMTIKLGVGAAPAVTTGHVVRYRIKGSGTMVVDLLQGSTTIASWTHASMPTIFTTYEQTLTGHQAASISDYSDLRLRFTTS